jgi:hypothetical protein
MPTFTCGFAVSRSAEGVERIDGIELDQHGLICVPAPVGALQSARVAPNLGFRHASVSLKDTDHRPAIWPDTIVSPTDGTVKERLESGTS